MFFGNGIIYTGRKVLRYVLCLCAVFRVHPFVYCVWGKGIIFSVKLNNNAKTAIAGAKFAIKTSRRRGCLPVGRSDFNRDTNDLV